MQFMSGARTGGGFSSRLNAHTLRKPPPLLPNVGRCSDPLRNAHLCARPFAGMVSLRGRAHQISCRSAWIQGMTSTWTREIDGLRGQLGKLKDVRHARLLTRSPARMVNALGTRG